METILLEILDELRARGRLDAKRLASIFHRHNRKVSDTTQHFSKKRLMPWYLKIRESDPDRWTSWNIGPVLEEQLLQVLQIKTRRTASGVATITVVTKPWKCASNCLYCPNDLRMPKSYLSDEPACQRAERNYFDPYLQVVSRLRALTHMGHVTDKVELIILGGSFSDYPTGYQFWFITELFRALNDGCKAEHKALERRRFYRDRGFSNRPEVLAEFIKATQLELNGGLLTYNQAVEQLYEKNERWQGIASEQLSGLSELLREHTINETAGHRVVGLVIETRPDAISCESLSLFRRFGCTKVQVGIQSINPEILRLNNRSISLDTIHKSFELLRLFGFKIHAHFMVNLYGSTIENDKLEYRRFVSEKPYLPDEVKLYPCALVEGTGLCKFYEDASWKPYSEEELLDVLTANLLDTPPFIRISRMVRDISAKDILAGNKTANLRQIVEKRIRASGGHVSEIRYREISTSETAIEDLRLETVVYETAVTDEYFLQWVTPADRIVGFLRLSLPQAAVVEGLQPGLPIGAFQPLLPIEGIQPLLPIGGLQPELPIGAFQPGLPFGVREAMIREVHVYGKVAKLHKTGRGAQHLGLGKQLIELACEIARKQDYTQMNVISSVGTREYYHSLGFSDNGLYQQKSL